MMQRNVFVGASVAAGLGYILNCTPEKVSCNQEPYTLDHVHCIINEAGYDISKEDTIKLVRVVTKENIHNENMEGIESVVWSIRNQVETAKVWERYDGPKTGGYPKGNNLSSVMARGQYDAIDAFPWAFQTYDVDMQDPFMVTSGRYKLNADELDKVKRAIVTVFSSPLEKDITCGAALYKNNAVSTQTWHRNPRFTFGYMQNYRGKDVECWHEYIGKRGRDMGRYGQHSFYRVDCDLDNQGRADGKKNGWKPLVDHYDSTFCQEE